MKRNLLARAALLCMLLLAACVSANPRIPSQTSQLYSLGQELWNSANSAGADVPATTGLPATYAEFKSRCQSAATSPEGAVSMYFDAVFCYLEPRRRAEAAKMLRYIMHADAGWERSQRYATFVRRLRAPSRHYIFKSFAAGTSPENGYAMSPQSYRLVFSGRSRESDYTRIFLRSSGADSRRIVWVKQYQDGLWYVINNADTYLDVRAPRTAGSEHSHDADYDGTY